jgi:hypothetical protein
MAEFMGCRIGMSGDGPVRQSHAGVDFIPSQGSINSATVCPAFLVGLLFQVDLHINTVY